MQKAHPFFWLLCVLSVPSAAATVVVAERAPAYALGSGWLYRLEVGGAFFIGVLVLALIFWLGYSGRSIGKIELPGGGGVDLAHPNLDLD